MENPESEDVKGIADSFREEHPEWFQEWQPVAGHHSTEVVEQFHEEHSESDHVKRITDYFREKHPTWFDKWE